MTAFEFQFKLINLKESLMSFAYRLTVNKDDAQDLVQDTFFKALKHCDKYVDDSNFKAWIYTIMKNTFINNYRQSLLQNTYYAQNNELFFFNQTKSTGFDDPDSTYSFLEITQTIEQLEDKFRKPFKMHINGYKYKEIADELNLNIGTVKSRIFFSRKQLKDKLNS
jgi:RNA polymerase sigma factor (sigma-70 family)